MNKIVTLGMMLSVLVISGCAGTDFKRLNQDQFVYGQDSIQTIRSKLGKPYQEGMITKNDKQFKTMSYAYASTGGEAAYKGVVAARSQGFYFYDNKLVGHEFTSSWAVDSTDFDSSKLSEIKKGETTINEAIELLGKPGGEYIFPLTPNESEKAKVYLYNQTKGSAFNLKFFQKLLVLTYGNSGVVTNVEYTESGNN